MKLIALSGQTPVITTRISTFIVLNLVDFILTAIIIESGLGFEGNPAFFSLSLLGIGSVKLMIGLAVIKFFGDKAGLMRLLNAGIGAVVIWNLFALIIAF